MATSEPKDLRWWRGWGLAKSLMCLIALVVLVTGILVAAGAATKKIKQAANTTIQTAAQEQVQVPGLPGVVYQSGSADKMAQLLKATSPKGQPSRACQYWQSLGESLKRGLAFVDAGVVPSCADKRYVNAAKAEHQHRPQDSYNNKSAYYDLGNPVAPWDYIPKHYSCSDLKSWTKYRYVPPAQPKLSYDQWAYLSNLQNFSPGQMTAAQKRQLDEDNKATKAVESYQEDTVSGLRDIYTHGGTFDKGCYPPGVVFGADQTVTFYPAHPVASLRESGAPVFYGAGGSNLIGVGHPYTIKPGDSPSSVATKFYGDWDQWSLIVAANNLVALTPTDNWDYTFDVSKLKWAVGQVIYLPNTSDYGNTGQ